MTMETAMDTTERARMERLARRMKLANRVMRRLLGLPFRTPLSNQLMLVFHTGRRTGRRYRQPVSYVRDGVTLLTPGGGKWTRNLRDGEPVELRLAGRRTVARPELIAEVDEIERLARHMFEVNPRLARFVPFIGKDGTVDRDMVANGVKYGFRIVRWHLDETRSS